MKKRRYILIIVICQLNNFLYNNETEHRNNNIYFNMLKSQGRIEDIIASKIKEQILKNSYL